MKFDTLYKRTSSGAVQEWYQETNDENLSQYRTVSGQQNGKHVESDWRQCEGTNVGKKNERSPEAQAQFEIKSNYKKKLDQGDYHKDVKDIDTPKQFNPMLAYEYEKKKAKVNFKRDRYYSQSKLDGIRCVAKYNGLFTRKGKPITAVPHIHAALMRFFVDTPDLVFDGELYNHSLKDDFNKIASLVKKVNPDKDRLKEAQDIIQFHIYDVTTLGGTPAKFAERMTILTSLEDSVSDQVDYIKIVKTDRITSEEQLESMYKKYLNEGYEGLMLRKDAEYENKRSNNLLKYKPEYDDEFELLDILEGKGNYQGVAKMVVLQHPNGTTFRANLKGKQADNRIILKNKKDYIGTMTTVTYGTRTPDDVPLFGRVKELNRTDNI